MIQPVATTNGQPRIDLVGRRILVVEDDRMNARIISSILRPEGYVIDEVDSGETALAAYPKFRPDLVLLDVVMGGINGFETCRQLKADPAAASIPVIFITAKNQPKTSSPGSKPVASTTSSNPSSRAR
jgi:CheY-like chemotaxis protein